MNNCDCCFNDFLAKCEEEIVINTNLTTGDSYRWVITNKFGNKYEGTAIAGEDGELTIPVEDLPPGMFTQYSSDFTLHLFGADSCSPIKFKLTGEYDCVTFNIHGGTFEKNNIGCTTTFVPGIQPPSALAAVLAVGNDADGLQIKNAADPTDPQDLVTLEYYENNLPASPTPGINSVLAVGQALTGTKDTILSPNAILSISDDLGAWLLLDNTESNQAVKLISPNNGNTGYSEVILDSNDDAGYKFKLESTNGVQDVFIIGKGDANNSLEYTAGTHNFTGDVLLDTNINAAGVEIAATFAAISASTKKRLIYVTADETNNGDISLYIHNGTILKLVQTLQP